MPLMIHAPMDCVLVPVVVANLLEEEEEEEDVDMSVGLEVTVMIPWATVFVPDTTGTTSAAPSGARIWLGVRIEAEAILAV